MKLFILLAAVIATASGCACPRILDPVCGDDGTVHDNECLLACAGATQAPMSECEEPKLCACGYILLEVCGKDGITYPNECTMKCKDVELDYEGECDARKKRDACNCPEQLELPVCGADGITYNSMCELGCAQTTFRFLGHCDPTPAPTTSPAPTEAPVVCTADYTPVCGDDGVTYANECMLNATENVSLAQEGECSSTDDNRRRRAAVDPAGEKCNCPNQMDLPVCGKDGITYNNMCALGCGGAGFRFLGHCPVTPAPETTTAEASTSAAPEASTTAEAVVLPACVGDDCSDDN